MTMQMVTEHDWKISFWLHCVIKMGIYLLICLGHMLIVCVTSRIRTKNVEKDKEHKRAATMTACAVVIINSLCWIPTTVLGKHENVQLCS